MEIWTDISISIWNDDYKRISPEVINVFEAVKTVRELYPDSDYFMASELEEPVNY